MVLCYLLFVLFYVLSVCKCVLCTVILPPGDNPIAVNKYIKFLFDDNVLRNAKQDFGLEIISFEKRNDKYVRNSGVKP